MSETLMPGMVLENEEIPPPPAPEQIKTEEEIKLEEYELKYPEEIRKSLVDVTRDLDKEQQSIRETHLIEWKKLDYYWQNLQNIYWDVVARDWRPYEEGIRGANPEFTEEDIGRVINVYRAYGESIIAGLSSTIPGVRFAPDNADNPDDISTAKAYGKIANLIQVHNNASILIVKALFTLFNQGFVACYNYNHTSPEFGTIKTPKTIEEEYEVEKNFCPNCGSEIEEVDTVEEEGQIFNVAMCPTCMEVVQPEPEIQTQKRLIETYEDCPKAREILEIYGPLNVKVPFYVSKLQNSPYLILETEHHYSLAVSLFPHLEDKIQLGTSADSSYERWARQPSEARDMDQSDLVTFRRVWLRPWAYYMIEDKGQREHLKKTYPNGVYYLLINETFAEAFEENMDDHWTITQNPTSMYIHAAPLGRMLVDIQDMTNDMYNLTLRTILYGIPMTFAEANAIDWDKFANSPSEPGNVYPAKVQPGQNLSGMFHTVKTATLSKEVDTFDQRLLGAGQFVSGAFPSIYGGTLEGGSGTYKEYESSRNQALQRLSLIWKMLNIWWKDSAFKACKEYANNLVGDESYAKRTGESYINVWIKKAELQGKVGEVEAESSDQFPITENQKRTTMMEFIANPSPVMQAIISHPENIGLVARLVGFGELYIPGNDQRNKQLVENLMLMNSEPIPTAELQMDELGQPVLDEMGQPQMVLQSSIPIEPVDNDEIHSETSQAFIISDAGQYLKATNPTGYQNIFLHWQAHQQNIAMKAEQQMLQQLEMEKLKNVGNESSGSGAAESGKQQYQ